jgi:hypothetical protein
MLCTLLSLPENVSVAERHNGADESTKVTLREDGLYEVQEINNHTEYLCIVSDNLRLIHRYIIKNAIATPMSKKQWMFLVMHLAKRFHWDAIVQ